LSGDADPRRSAAEHAVYADLSRLNNELATAERRLIKANVQLDRANGELRALYEALPVGIFRADAAGRIEQANERFRSLAGVTLADAWLSGVHENDREGVGRSWRQTIDRGVVFDRVYRLAGGGPVPRHVAMKAISFNDASGKAGGIVGFVEDVSEHVLAEQRQREIERLDAVRELTGGLAHNLNNIMMVVLNTAEQLCDDLPVQHELHTVAQKNLEASERAALLTRRLMIYGGSSDMFFGSVAVDAAIEAICRDLRAALAGRYELSLSLGAPGVAIKMDKTLLAEALQALVANAQAAMPLGGTIQVATVTGVEGQAPVRHIAVISVTDSGVGMDEETLRHAKDPFFTTREVGQGIGLGLSLADGAARIAKGVLEIHSQLGKSTVAELRLPVVE
jgi:PAS domain S-box-containing protein